MIRTLGYFMAAGQKFSFMNTPDAFLYTVCEMGKINILRVESNQIMVE